MRGDNQGPHTGLGRGVGCLGRWPVLQAVGGSTPLLRGAVVGSAVGLRGPLSSWGMLEFGKAWRGDQSQNRVLKH